MGRKASIYEWRNKRDRLELALERVENAPQTLLERGLVTLPQKRKVYESGIVGEAEILKAPGKWVRSEVEESQGTFGVRVKLRGEEPYETRTTQSFDFGFESAALVEGAVVECRVDPENRKRVLLCAPEPPDDAIDREIAELEAPQESSAAAIVASGKPAVGTVRSAELSEIPAPPGSDGRIWDIEMELHSESERRPWKVKIHQRVPEGAEELLAKGAELKVGYAKRKSNRDVAIDWPGSSGGRLS
jgi:hypothetical protein